MELRRLRDAFHSGDFGEQLGEEAEFVEEFEATAGSALGEELGELFADAFRRNDVDFARVSADGGESCGFDGVGRNARRSGRRATCGVCLRRNGGMGRRRRG